MGPNHADVVRVYTREKGAQIADYTLSSGQDAEVVVEVEAGKTIFDEAAMYQTGLVIKDLADGSSVTFNPAAAAGQLGDASWPTQDYAFTYTIGQADLAPHAGHLCEAYAYLLIGRTDFDASFAESPLFLIQP